VLVRDGRAVPIIPRYLDLLLLLVAKRHQAVHRREIQDAVWSDVVVSEGALTQAVRALRRALGDDTREPAFIRTVARHGYQFIGADVSEEDDGGPLSGAAEPAGAGALSRPIGPAVADADASPPADALLEEAVLVLLAPGPLDTEERRDAAERLHAIGTARAIAAVDARPGHAGARALLRETRWDVPGAGAVPILGAPAAVRTAAAVAWLRIRRALRVAEPRWAGAIVAAAAAGLLAGAIGGLALRFGPGSTATGYVPVVLALLGAALGATGAAGVAAGLCAAEVLARSWRAPALVALGGTGGALVGAAAHAIAQWTLRGLFGRDLEPIVGGLEGLALGAATGLGYALATRGDAFGFASPRGAARWRAALTAGLLAAAAGVLLALTGGHLGALSLDLMARSFPGSQVGLAPLARLVGEKEPGAVTAAAISAWEGLLFAAGTVCGLTRRPRSE
jgi:DNA-binding winged helix-turn-helix (wHTH) protein